MDELARVGNEVVPVEEVVTGQVMDNAKLAVLLDVQPARATGGGAAYWRVYRCEPPMPHHRFLSEDCDYDDMQDVGTCTCPPAQYVVVSAAYAMFSGPETYIFAADEHGEWLDSSELPGSFQGAMDHEAALENAGYTPVTESAFRVLRGIDQ